jgi:hypothetical protein
MFAHDLCHSQIEYFRLRPVGDCDYAPEGRSYGSERNSIDLNRKDRAKRYHKSSIPACPGWVKDKCQWLCPALMIKPQSPADFSLLFPRD